MRIHIAMTVLLIATIALLSACGIMRCDMFNPGNDSNKGSGEKITVNTAGGGATKTGRLPPSSR